MNFPVLLFLLFVFPWMAWGNPTSDLQSGTPREVVFIDTAVAGWPVLAAGVKPGVEVVLLDAGKDGLAQMVAWVQGRSGYDEIHLLSHGAPGQMRLGAFDLNRQTLDERAGAWAGIGAALKEDSDLLLY